MSLKQKLASILKHDDEQHLDINYIDDLIKEGLNVNLNQAWELQVQESGFVKRLLFSLVIDFMTIFANIAADVTWNDPDTNRAVVGNFYIGLGYPKEVIVLVCRSMIIFAILKYLLAYRIYKQDGNLYNLLQLVKSVTGTGSREVHPKVLEQVKQEATKMAASLKLQIRTLHGPFVGASIVAFGGLFIGLKSDLKGWNIVPAIIWSLHWGIMNQSMIVQLMATIVIAMIVSTFVRHSINMMNEEVRFVQNEADHDQLQITFQRHVHQLMFIVTSIRHYNHAIRLVIGFGVFLCFSLATLGGFAIFFCPIPDFLRLLLFGLVSSFLAILIFMLKHFADSSIQMQKGVKFLSSQSMLVGLKPAISHRLNYVIEEMRFNTSFDCSKFIPDINYLFIITVMCEMVSFILLAVRIYVVNPGSSS